jgi:hypothetical protein
MLDLGAEVDLHHGRCICRPCFKLLWLYHKVTRLKAYEPIFTQLFWLNR